jgi:hypothetical protein
MTAGEHTHFLASCRRRASIKPHHWSDNILLSQLPGLILHSFRIVGKDNRTTTELVQFLTHPIMASCFDQRQSSFSKSCVSRSGGIYTRCGHTSRDSVNTLVIVVGIHYLSIIIIATAQGCNHKIPCTFVFMRQRRNRSTAWFQKIFMAALFLFCARVFFYTSTVLVSSSINNEAAKVPPNDMTAPLVLTTLVVGGGPSTAKPAMIPLSRV